MKKKYPIILTTFTLIVYIVMSYGGIRSPDAEIVFRTTEALSTKSTFAVSEQLSWLEFGLPRGIDGKRYSIFGPGQAIAAIPFYLAANELERTGWYADLPSFVPVSFNINKGLSAFVNKRTPNDLRPHSIRAITALLNPVISSICVLIFFLLMYEVTGSDISALITSIVFAFGTLLLPYSGTFFSECLATLFLTSSLYVLIREKGNDIPYITLAFSGLLMGFAAFTHLTAILFAPFFCWFGAYAHLRCRKHSIRTYMKRMGAYSIGVMFVLIVLAYHNYIRFGDVFETGRTMNPNIIYGSFVAPWRGLWGLLMSSGKGLLIYCPAVIAGIVLWKPFHKRHRMLSLMIISAALFRILFIASRSDWHGGFSLGPRYMVMLVPFLIIPVGLGFKSLFYSGKVKQLWIYALITLLFVSEQLYFAIGEVFSYLHIVKWKAEKVGINVFDDDYLYLDWSVSPVVHLLDWYRGPLLLSMLPISNISLWLTLTLISGSVLYLIYYRIMKYMQNK